MNGEYPDEAALTGKFSGGFVYLFIGLFVCLADTFSQRRNRLA